MNVEKEIQETTIVRRKGMSSQFAQIPNRVLRDTRLSFEACGLLVELLSHADTFIVRMEVIQKQRCIGREQLRRMFKELEIYGYAELITREKSEEGKFRGKYWEVNEEGNELSSEEGNTVLTELQAKKECSKAPRGGLPAYGRTHP